MPQGSDQDAGSKKSLDEYDIKMIRQRSDDSSQGASQQHDDSADPFMTREVVRLIRDSSPGSLAVKEQLDELGIPYEEHVVRERVQPWAIEGSRLPSLAVPARGVVYYGPRDISNLFIKRFLNGDEG